MIECPSCGKKHRPGTLFCTECGVYLPAGGALRTSPLATDELPGSRATTWGKMPAGAEAGRENRSLTLEVVDSGRQAQLPATSEILLGRLDAAHGIFPDLDLTADGGLGRGVSRRHAKIVQRSGEFFVEDVGSANGTFLNGQRLTPYLPYPLHSGDEVQLGRVKLSITWE